MMASHICMLGQKSESVICRTPSCPAVATCCPYMEGVTCQVQVHVWEACCLQSCANVLGELCL